MKKTLAILALALFIGGISVPAIATSNNALKVISLQDDDPKKKAKSEKSEAKKETSKEATKTSNCSGKKKSDCSGKKKSDCSGEKKSDCSGKCGGESK